MTMLYNTLDGLKRRAKKRERATGCAHSEALEQLAREGGFSSYAQARQSLLQMQAPTA